MSMQVSYKKQIVLCILLLSVLLMVTEISLRIWEFSFVKCNFEDADTLEYNFFEKKVMCNDLSKIIYNLEPVLTIKPNQHYNTININNLGFRGEEFKNNENYKIFVVGGSTVFGTGVHEDETIPYILENKFLKTDKIEVINAGIPSMNSNEELFHIKNTIFQLNPDLIIIYDGNNEISFDNTVFKINYSDEKEIGFSDFQEFFRTPVIIYRYIIIPISNSVENSDIELNISDASTKEKSDEISEKWVNNMLEFCDFTKTNKIESIVILQPSLIHGEKKLSEFEKTIELEDYELYKKTFSKMQKNITKFNECSLSIDFSNIFRDVQDGIYFDHVHLNKIGNEIVAEKIYEKIEPIIKNELIS